MVCWLTVESLLVRFDSWTAVGNVLFFFSGATLTCRAHKKTKRTEQNATAAKEENNVLRGAEMCRMCRNGAQYSRKRQLQEMFGRQTAGLLRGRKQKKKAYYARRDMIRLWLAVGGELSNCQPEERAEGEKQTEKARAKTAGLLRWRNNGDLHRDVETWRRSPLIGMIFMNDRTDHCCHGLSWRVAIGSEESLDKPHGACSKMREREKELSERAKRTEEHARMTGGNGS